MYLRLFSFFLFFNEKGFVNLILEWASPRLALNIAYSSDHTESKRGAGLRSPLLQHGPSGPLGLQHSPEVATGL